MRKECLCVRVYVHSVCACAISQIHTDTVSLVREVMRTKDNRT